MAENRNVPPRQAPEKQTGERQQMVPPLKEEDIPLTWFDKLRRMLLSKEEWEAYLLEKQEKENKKKEKDEVEEQQPTESFDEETAVVEQQPNA